MLLFLLFSEAFEVLSRARNEIEVCHTAEGHRFKFFVVTNAHGKKILSKSVVIYPVHLRTRKSFGLMTRKLSVTKSRKLAQFLGTLSRKKSSVASAKCPHVA